MGALIFVQQLLLLIISFIGLVFALYGIARIVGRSTRAEGPDPIGLICCGMVVGVCVAVLQLVLR